MSHAAERMASPIVRGFPPRIHPRVAAWSEALLSRPSLAPWIAKEGRLMAKVTGG